MQPPMVTAERELTATLQAQEWQIIFTALRELPYRMSAALIAKLESEINTAASAAPRLPNGRDATMN